MMLFLAEDDLVIMTRFIFEKRFGRRHRGLSVACRRFGGSCGLALPGRAGSPQK